MPGQDDIERWLERVGGELASHIPGVPDSLRNALQLLSENPAPPPTGTVAVTEDPTIANLDRIEHIVVLMLENRSFDHMLGYLSLEGGRSDVDGLKAEFSNSYNGQEYPVHHCTRTAWDGELEDPCHGPKCIDLQLLNDNSGFVQSYAEYVAGFPKTHGSTEPVDLSLVMSYFDASDLPVYDFLAREYCVCDRWYSSVPGATWPNRLYAMCGRADKCREDRDPPIYNLPTFVRFLDQFKQTWKWYSYDPGTLRAADAEYRLSHHANFAYVDQRKLSTKERLAGELLEERNSFLDDAAADTLPAVSWIDPHFKDIRVFGPDSNDDHPPSDVLAGQSLVLDVYHALKNSKAWPKTLFLITYDEHGGIYDHVSPPPAPDDDPEFRRYGVRVPAIVVSPWVEAGSVAPREPVFDHTSIIKTILLRFCQDGGRIPDMGLRVTSAHHLGGLLSRTEMREDIAPHAQIGSRLTDWHAELASQRYADFSTRPGPRTLNHLQSGFLTTARMLREAGLPAGHP